jgi:hypothetical protein
MHQSNLYTVEVHMTFGSGAPQYAYDVGFGRAVSRSPKKAFEAARDQADVSPWCIVLEHHLVRRGSTVLFDGYV